jgi:ABC-2 type transport system ATP-binding protein
VATTVERVQRDAASTEPVEAAHETPLLEANGLTKRYGRRAALRNVSITTHRGEKVAVIGPNGAGKTTLLSILAGNQRADEGTVNRTADEIGWVPQQAALYGKLTVRENLKLFARLERCPDPNAAVDRMLDQTRLRDRADDQVSVLSGGNRQRVNIAIGLLANPGVLLLDEPSAALDPRQREYLWEFIDHLSDSGTSVVYATHYIEEVDRYADTVVVLADGERLFSGSPQELERVAAEEAPGREPMSFEASFVAFLREQGH